MGKGESKPHFIVFYLTHLAKGEQLYPVYAGMGSGDFPQGGDILRRVVEGGEDHLSQGGGDALLIQIRKIFELSHTVLGGHPIQHI